jgi:hypothetical protein
MPFRFNVGQCVSPAPLWMVRANKELAIYGGRRDALPYVEENEQSGAQVGASKCAR